MTKRSHGIASPGDGAQDGPFHATVAVDSALESQVMVLRYDDQARPSRGITVGIAPELGSNMYQFRVGEHDLIYCDMQALKRRDFTGNFVLWPIPNRVRDKRYVYQGRTYALTDVTRPQGNDVLIHGLVFDRPWQHDVPVVGRDSARVTTHVDIKPDDPLFHVYPFESRLSLTYTLTSMGVTVAYRVENKGTTDLPFGFALHPYFATLSGIEDTLVSIPAAAVMEADDQLLPTGRLLPLDGIMYAMFDLRAPVPVGHLKLDHVYTRLDTAAGATIDYRQQAMRLRLSASEDFTHMVIYTSPEGDAFLCLENQTCATDALNLRQRGLQDLAHLLEVPPGGTSSGQIRYTVEYDE